MTIHQLKKQKLCNRKQCKTH